MGIFNWETFFGMQGEEQEEEAFCLTGLKRKQHVISTSIKEEDEDEDERPKKKQCVTDQEKEEGFNRWIASLSSQSTNLMDLSSELKMEIFGYLLPAMMGLVCSEFRQLTSDYYFRRTKTRPVMLSVILSDCKAPEAESATPSQISLAAEAATKLIVILPVFSIGFSWMYYLLFK